MCFTQNDKKAVKRRLFLLEIADLNSLTHFDKTGFELCDNAHLQVEADGQVGVLVGRVDGTADEEVNVGGLLKDQAADE